MVRELRETMKGRRAKTRRGSVLPELAAVLGRMGAVTVSVAGASAVLTHEVASALREIVDHALRGDAVAVVARRAEMGASDRQSAVVRFVGVSILGAATLTAGCSRDGKRGAVDAAPATRALTIEGTNICLDVPQSLVARTAHNDHGYVDEDCEPLESAVLSTIRNVACGD